MKIAMFFELRIGGAKRAVIEIAKNVSLLQHNVCLFSVDPHTSHVQNVKIPHRSYIFSERIFVRGFQRLLHDTLDLFRLAFLHDRIARDIRAWGAQCVLVHPSWYTQAPWILFFLKLYAIPTVYYCQEPLRIAHDPVYRIPKIVTGIKRAYETLNRQWRSMIDRFLFHCADRILCNSLFSQQEILRVYGIQAHVCYLGVNTSVFYPMKTEKTYDLFYLGTKDTVEGYDLFVQAISCLKHVPKIFAVDTREHGTSISDTVLCKMYNSSAYTVCLSRNEPFGLIALESMACGTPVIALNEGGFKESVRDKETGFLVPPDSIKIAHTIQYALAHRRVRETMRKTSINNVQHQWTWRQTAQRIETQMYQVVQKA